MTTEQYNQGNSKEGIFSIWVSLLGFIIVYTIIVGVLGGISGGGPAFSEISKTAGMERAQIFGSVGNLVLSMVATTLITMVKGGFLLAIYRRVRYGTKPQLGELFYFFNDNVGNNMIIAFLITLLTELGTVLFIIPGVILSLGFYLWPFVLYEYQEGYRHGRSLSVTDTLRTCWERTVGLKGQIFLVKALVALAIGAIIGTLVGLFIMAGGLSFLAPGGYPGPGAAIGFLGLGIFLLVPLIFILGLFHNLGDIYLMRELPVDRGVDWNEIYTDGSSDSGGGPQGPQNPQGPRNMDDPMTHTNPYDPSAPRVEAYRENPFDTTRYPEDHFRNMLDDEDSKEP